VTLTIAKLAHVLAWALLVLSSIQKNRLISSPEMNETSVLKMRFWDKVSGAMSGLMLLSGLGMLLWWAKPTDYYTDSVWFLIKMVFFVVGSTWIVLTKIWMRRALRAAQWPQSAPGLVKGGLRFDLICLSVMTLCGLSLAHGSFF